MKTERTKKEVTRASACRQIASTSDEGVLRSFLGHKNIHVKRASAHKLVKLGFSDLTQLRKIFDLPVLVRVRFGARGPQMVKARDARKAAASGAAASGAVPVAPAVAKAK